MKERFYMKDILAWNDRYVFYMGKAEEVGY